MQHHSCNGKNIQSILCSYLATCYDIYVRLKGWSGISVQVALSENVGLGRGLCWPGHHQDFGNDKADL